MPIETMERSNLVNEHTGDSRDSHCSNIPRPSYTQAGFDGAYIQLLPKKTGFRDVIKQARKPRCSSRRLKHLALKRLPVLQWLRTYPVKEYLLADVVTGFTVAMFHVPQSLGYALLAAVPPVCALYNAMFPMMIYFILGTARQASVGADAVTSMMTGTIVRELTSGDVSHDGLNPHNSTQPVPYTVAEVTSALCLTIGIIQLVFSFLSLGALNVFLSEQMINGFATGVAIQVVVSQLGSLFGNRVPHMSGMFTIYKTIYAFFDRIDDVAWQTTLVAFVAVAIIMAVKIFLDPSVLKRLGIPLPIELVVVVLFTLASHYLDMKENHGIAVVGTVPQVLPEPSLPSFNTSLIAAILPQSFVMAIVSFAITLSLGRIFGLKHGYSVDANQEFLALGASHVFSSFFSCFPLAASVPRSAVQEGAGGKTQIVSIVNIIIIVFMILFLGHYLEELPICVLAAIIVTSLKSIVMQVRNFKLYWNISKIDGQVWIVSFCATVVFDIITGLVFGIIFSLLTLIYKIQRPKSFLLGPVADTEFFAPIKKYQMVTEIPMIKIFHFGGPVHFANTEYFRSQLNKKVGFTVRDVLKARKGALESSVSNLGNVTRDIPVSSSERKIPFDHSSAADGSTLRPNGSATDTLVVPSHIILDFSRVSFVDGTSIGLLKQLKAQYDSINVRLFIAACSHSVFNLLCRAEAINVFGSDGFFPTVFDAVRAAQQQNKLKLAGTVPQPLSSGE